MTANFKLSDKHNITFKFKLLKRTAKFFAFISALIYQFKILSFELALAPRVFRNSGMP